MAGVWSAGASVVVESGVLGSVALIPHRSRALPQASGATPRPRALLPGLNTPPPPKPRPRCFPHAAPGSGALVGLGRHPEASAALLHLSPPAPRGPQAPGAPPGQARASVPGLSTPLHRHRTPSLERRGPGPMPGFSRGLRPRGRGRSGTCAVRAAVPRNGPGSVGPARPASSSGPPEPPRDPGTTACYRCIA